MRGLEFAWQGAAGSAANRPPTSRCLSIALDQPMARQVQYILDREIPRAHRGVQAVL